MSCICNSDALATKLHINQKTMLIKSKLYCPKTDNDYNKHECEVELLLNELGLKRSKDRHHLVSLFHAGDTWSTSEILNALHHTDKTTVYRNLEKLSDKGLIKVIETLGSETRYEWAHQKHHDHNSCNKCKLIECVPCPIPKIQNHSLQLKQLCKACA